MKSASFPQPLSRGDCVGIIAPAGQIRDTDLLERGVLILKDMGFEVRLPRNLWPGTGYLADSDSNRALEFHRMWADPEIPALLALRGGFGCLRLLDFIDSAEIQKNQKILIGFSDITIIHGALYQANKTISLHGPVLSTLSTCNRESLERFYASLTGKWDASIRSRQVEVLRGGNPVQGRLAGGNLSSLISVISTPLDQDWSNTILFLEDVGEPLYRLDRMLTQLAHCGKLKQPAGIILGDFSLTAEQDPIEKIRFHEEIWQRVLELTAATVPIWGNFPVGHGPANLTLPHGAAAVMDSSKALLSFLRY
ncbi:MAG: LD-carboxypeptidase [Desulfocapsa sp.]|nr:LD-carboxypeptidase [Desulfocapsa sp.]